MADWKLKSSSKQLFWLTGGYLFAFYAIIGLFGGLTLSKVQSISNSGLVGAVWVPVFGVLALHSVISAMRIRMSWDESDQVFRIQNQFKRYVVRKSDVIRVEARRVGLTGGAGV